MLSVETLSKKKDLLDLPSEAIEEILLNVPLPNLLNRVSRIPQLFEYIADDKFWQKRAQIMYHVSSKEFREKLHESFGSNEDQVKIPGFIVYLEFLKDVLRLENSSYLEAAGEEIDDIERYLTEELRRLVIEKIRQNPDIKTYYLGITRVKEWQRPDYDTTLIPAVNVEEEILNVDRYLKLSGERWIRTFVIDYLDTNIDALIDAIGDNISLKENMKGFITYYIEWMTNNFQQNDGLGTFEIIRFDSVFARDPLIDLQ